MRGDYVMNDETLYHHGIKGMKWGVRRFQNKDGTLTSAGKKREYGMSKRGLKSAIKKARKKTGYLSGRTGENWNEAIQAQYDDKFSDKQTKDIKKKALSAYKKAEYYSNRDDIVNAEKYQEIGDDLYKKYSKLSKAEGAKYVNLYKDALLKDIGYKNVEKGKRMLDDYGIDVVMDKYGNAKIVRK